MSIHEYVQAVCLFIARELAFPEDDDTVEWAVEWLIGENHDAIAAALLFGISREHADDRIVVLYNGVNGDILLDMARHHHWSDHMETTGMSIEIYPGEWFVYERVEAPDPETKP